MPDGQTDRYDETTKLTVALPIWEHDQLIGRIFFFAVLGR